MISLSMLKEQETWSSVLSTINDKVVNQAGQYIDSLTAMDNTLQSSSKTKKKTVSTISDNCNVEDI